MDLTNFSQTMDIDVDFDGNQSYQRKLYFINIVFSDYLTQSFA